MHKLGSSNTLDLMQHAAAQPCFATLEPLRARLEEIAGNLCTLYPAESRFPKMQQAIHAARQHLLDAQRAAEAGDGPSFLAARDRLAETFAEIGAGEVDLTRWTLPSE